MEKVSLHFWIHQSRLLIIFRSRTECSNLLRWQRYPIRQFRYYVQYPDEIQNLIGWRIFITRRPTSSDIKIRASRFTLAFRDTSRTATAIYTYVPGTVSSVPVHDASCELATQSVNEVEKRKSAKTIAYPSETKSEPELSGKIFDKIEFLNERHI